MSDEGDALLDIKQAAAFLHVSETSLRRWTNAGRLACVRVGRKRDRRFRRGDLLAFLEEQPVQGVPPILEPDIRQRERTVIAGLPVAYGSHLCGLYSTDEGGVAQAVTFLADGLGPGSACFLVATPADRRAIVAQLGRARPSLQTDIDAGRLTLTDYAASAAAQYDFFGAAFTRARGAGAQSLRVVGVLTSFLDQGVAAEELVAYEAGYDQRFPPHFPLVTLCQYDVRRLSSLSVLAALKGHPDNVHYPVERWLS